MLNVTYLYMEAIYSTIQGKSTPLTFKILNYFPIHTMWWELSFVQQMDFLLIANVTLKKKKSMCTTWRTRL